MAANDVTANKSVHLTLDTTEVDTVTFEAAWPLIEIINRDDTELLWVTVSLDGEDPTAPVAAAADTEVVLPGERVAIVNSRSATATAIIKVLGSGNQYSVVGSTRG